MKKNIFLKNFYTVYILLLLFPLLLSAQLQTTDFKGFVHVIVNQLIVRAIPVVIGLITIAFLWGMAVFILNSGNEEKREEGKKVMFWGLIGLFIVLSVWAIVAVLTGSFGFDFDIPQLKSGS